MCSQKSAFSFLPILLAIAILTMSPGVRAGDAASGALSVQDVWARPSIGKTPNSVVYLKISNSGDKADKLVGVSTDVAKHAKIHSTAMENGVMKMRPAEHGVAVPAKGAVELKPGGFHVMLMGLRQKLSTGEKFDIILKFEHQGDVKIPVEIKSLKYKG